MSSRAEISDLLVALNSGDRDAIHDLFPLVYDDLRRRAARLMAGEREGHTLQPTSLVHEAFFQIVGNERVSYLGRSHFFAVASRFMRRVLVDHARAVAAEKRGGGVTRLPLDGALQVSVARDADVLLVEEALEKLAALDPRHADIVTMRFFGGLSVDEVSAVLETPKRTVEAEWSLIRAWLRRELRA